MRKIKEAIALGMAVPALALLWAAGVGSAKGALFGKMIPTSSSSIALTSDDRFVWVANPDNNSVSLLEVGGDANRKLAEVRVGVEPQTVAVTPDDKKVYVTNMVSGTVSVINAATRRAVRVIPVGTEPFGCALTWDGTKLYVANFSSDSVSVIDTATDRVIKTIENVGPKPRGVAVNADGKVYVTQFLAQLRPDGRSIDQKEGRDDGKEGRVTVISSATDTVVGTLVLNPLADTGFKSNGSTLDRVGQRSADGTPTGPPVFDTVTGAFPNLLQSIAFKGNRLYLPNTASSPNGPFRFNVNVQSFLSVANTTSDTDSGQTINMNKGVQFEGVGKRLFITNPIALAFKQSADEGFVVSAATNRLVRVVLDSAGKPTINAPTAAGDPGNVVRIAVGKNPRGIVLNSTDTRAYVMNFLSRDVSVVDISGSDPSTYKEIARIASANLPPAGTLAAVIHRGHELFNTSIGPEGTNDNAKAPAGRMSDFGWGTCYSCHPSGLADGVTWMFPDGPRQSISMESTGEHPQPPSALLNVNGAPLLPAFKQHVLNWSAVRDEVQDFELNIRGVSGGQGLIRDGLAVVNLTPTANTGRDADLDAIAAYVTMGIRAPISPLRPKNMGGKPLVDFDVAAGRALFSAANCQLCHGGPNWTRSRVDFTPPPAAAEITAGQLARFLQKVGTFDPAAFNEVRVIATLNAPVPGANGALGINIPSILSTFAGAPYFHSGAAPTLEAVLDNVTHRSAGTGGVDTLANAADRAKLVKFLKSIDAKTVPFP